MCGVWCSPVRIPTDSIAVVVVMILYTSAGVLNVVENEPWMRSSVNYSANAILRSGVNYFDCLYMVVISITTIGYGSRTARCVGSQ